MLCVAFQKILTSHTGKPSHLCTMSLLLEIAAPSWPWAIPLSVWQVERPCVQADAGKDRIKWETEEEARSLASQHGQGCGCAVSLPSTVSTAPLAESGFVLLPSQGIPAASENNQLLCAASGAINNQLFTVGSPP